ncbi:secreted salivary [Pyrrhoderma noxium]|uniref:Secreted salivary n=1 Tax=Pyrrhoderma noxium TaxID=2282107 RepID=A0A286U8J0_9AGAM|nr:secreted salivary [Pyrrhoderma noxium]
MVFSNVTLHPHITADPLKNLVPRSDHSRGKRSELKKVSSEMMMTMLRSAILRLSTLFIAILSANLLLGQAVVSGQELGVVDLKGRVLWNEICPSYNELGHSKVVLDDGKSYTGSVLRNGSFLIPSVPEGSYILSVLSHDLIFDNLRVDISQPSSPSVSTPDSPDSTTKTCISVRPYIPGTPHNPPSTISLPYPLLISARQNVKKMYFSELQSFGKNALGMIQSPMVLMMVVMGVLVVGLPYLIKNMDPELAKEFNERQARVSGIQNAMQSGDLRGGLSALLAETDPSNLSRTPSPHGGTGAGGSPKPGGGGTAKSKTSKGGRRR